MYILQNSFKVFSWALTLVASIATIYPALAQNNSKDSTSTPKYSLKNYNLSDVEIRAREFQRIHNSPVPLQVLKGKTLDNLSSLSVADAVRFFSGVQLKDYGGIGGLKTINIRSLGTNHTSIFYDGLALGNAQNGQVDLGKFSLSNMEEIALYSGQNPDVLQPAKAYASANSIYLKTKTPFFKEDEVLKASMNLKGGSFGLINPDVAVDYKVSEKIFARVSSELLNANGHYKFRYTNGIYDTTALRSNTDIFALRLEASLHGKPDSLTSWALKYYHYNSERGLPGAIISNRFDYSQRLWDGNNFLQFDFQKPVTNWYTFALKGKLAKDYTRYLDPEFINLDGFLDNRYTQKEGYLSLANKIHILPFWQVNLSADYQYNTLDANLYRFAYPIRKTFLTVLATDVQVGNLNFQGSLLGTFVNEKVKKYNSAADKQAYTPTFMFNWQPFTANAIRFRGFYKSIFRMPTFNDLYYTFIGNTYLNPEYTEQYDLGISFTQSFNNRFLSQLDIQSDVYYNSVKDKIIAMPSANLFRWTMMNLGRVEIKGLEVGIKTQSVLTENFILSTGVNYTYQQAVDNTTDSYTYDHQIPYTPLHSGSFITSLSTANFGGHYSFIYSGERYSQKANIPVNYVEPWYTHDLTGWYSFKTVNHNYTLRAEVNNLLNQYYDVILNFPMPGRHFRFSLNISI